MVKKGDLPEDVKKFGESMQKMWDSDKNRATKANILEYVRRFAETEGYQTLEITEKGDSITWEFRHELSETIYVGEFSVKPKE